MASFRYTHLSRALCAWLIYALCGILTAAADAAHGYVQPLGLVRLQQRVFRVTDDASLPTVAKFVGQPFPEELHTRWAERGLVPPLNEGPDSALPRLHGLLQLVWMEGLEPGDGWQLLADVSSVSAEMEDALLAALTRHWSWQAAL